MKDCLHVCLMPLFAGLLLCTPSTATAAERVVDIPTRSGVTQRLLVQAPEQPKAAVVLFVGGQGDLRIKADGTIGWGRNKFLVRSRHKFVERGLLVAVIDAPSDRQSPPYLQGFRDTAEHALDVQAVIAWLRREAKVPVWLVGTSRGTQSVAFVATQLRPPDGPDGVVLTSSVLLDKKSTPVTDMALEAVRVPVLVVHHERDACRVCPQDRLPVLMNRLAAVPRKELIMVSGGDDVGDACESLAYHGYNGIEQTVVDRIVDWIVAP